MKDPLDQDIGLAHCCYIRRLAKEILIKESATPLLKRMDWKDAIREALALHVKKLKIKNIKNVRVAQVPPIKFISEDCCGWE